METRRWFDATARMTIAAMFCCCWVFASTQASAAGFSEYPLYLSFEPPYAPYHLTLGSDGAIWFTETAGSKIGRITTSGQITEYRIPLLPYGGTIYSPLGIALGPDGASWFTIMNADYVGRVYTNGQFTLLPVPAANTRPPDDRPIVTGPDKALWFVQPRFASIGRMTVGGFFSDIEVAFSNPPPGQPYGMALGSDGALWLTQPGPDEGCTSAIARVETTPVRGAFPAHEYPFPGFCGNPRQITEGPDQAMWFLVQSISNVNGIGRIDLQGNITFYPSYKMSPLLNGITSRPDGVWFTDAGNNSIGHMAPDGSVTEFGIPTTNSGPQDIIVGSDGALWFTEGNANKIGRYEP